MDIVVQTALMDMHIKCKSLDEARLLFSSKIERNVISWNAMIAGLGMNGLRKKALHYFKQMEVEGVLMDDLIFLTVLSACSHAGRAGQLDEAKNVIETMTRNLIDMGISASGLPELIAITCNREASGTKAEDSGVCTLMSNIYADLGMWEGMRRIVDCRMAAAEIFGWAILNLVGAHETNITDDKIALKLESNLVEI
ncbi:Pentatricopeptide repeat [Dillenia turbinata]|uniref:Pentatricopeptide repeat n=1 Tax=Dillenia turbinata TaxID=194707 RepID=A0AAN8Z3L4_9MAGN